MSSAHVLNLGSDLKLRVNASNRSILLKTADGLFECMECRQQFETRWTGDNWWHEITLFSKSEKDEEKELAWYKKNNDTPVIFRSLRESSGNSFKVAECELLKGDVPFESNEIKASFWTLDDKSLELYTEKNVEKKAWNAFETKKEYCNMLLFFHAVDFGEGISAAGKRMKRE